MRYEVNSFLFYSLSALIIISALIVVRAKNIFHAALSLGLTFFGVAGIYLTLKSEFLAGMQILVYVGAIVVLILFAIMLTAGNSKKEGEPFNKIQALAMGATFILAFFVGLIIFYEGWGIGDLGKEMFSTKNIGEILIRNYFIPFELVSVLLLAALIGAIVIAKKEETQTTPIESTIFEKGGRNV